MRLAKLTFLAFQINYLLDRGYYKLSIAEAKSKIRSKALFDDLEKMSRDDYLDLSLFDANDRKEILEKFEGFANNIDEDRKMGVLNNGLCLLLAYVIELIQENHNE